MMPSSGNPNFIQGPLHVKCGSVGQGARQLVGRRAFDPLNKWPHWSPTPEKPSSSESSRGKYPRILTVRNGDHYRGYENAYSGLLVLGLRGNPKP